MRIIRAGGLGVTIAVAFIIALTGCEKQDKLQITKIEPRQGPFNGQDPVTIFGTGFQQGAAKGVKVYFEIANKKAREARILRFEGNSKLLVEPPGAEEGDVADVLIVFEDGRQLTYPKAYQYTKPTTAYGVDMVGAKK